MNGSQDINLNSADCIYIVDDFGVKHIHNICTGTVSDLAWGLGSYASFGFVVIFALFMLAMVFAFIKMSFD